MKLDSDHRNYILELWVWDNIQAIIIYSKTHTLFRPPPPHYMVYLYSLFHTPPIYSMEP